MLKNMKSRSFSIRVDFELFTKIVEIAKTEDRTTNQQIINLIKRGLEIYNKEQAILESVKNDDET